MLNEYEINLIKDLEGKINNLEIQSSTQQIMINALLAQVISDGTHTASALFSQIRIELDKFTPGTDSHAIRQESLQKWINNSIPD